MKFAFLNAFLISIQGLIHNSSAPSMFHRKSTAHSLGPISSDLTSTAFNESEKKDKKVRKLIFLVLYTHRIL